MAERFVLLGHTGFLGSALLKVLRSQDAEVYGFSRVTLDLRNPDAFAQLDHLVDRSTTVIFASALTPDKGATLNVLQGNLDMAMNVARYLEDHPPGRCVYISTDAVYPLHASPITEETAVEPSNFNALGKYVGECVLRRVSETTNTPLLILRLVPLYGPGDTHGSYGPNQFVRSILKEGTVRLFGGGEEQRDHLHVDDATRLIVELLKIQAVGTYNLATGRSCSFSDAVEILRHVVPVPFSVVSVLRKMPVTHRCFETSKLFMAVPGFRFTSLDDGLRSYWTADQQHE